MPEEVIVPDTKSQLLRRWLQRLRLLELCHYEAAKPLASLNLALGIPVVILTTIVGTTVFGTLQKSVDASTKIWVAAISILAAVLSALQTFLRFSARASAHRSSAGTAGTYRREIEQILVDPNVDSISDDVLTELRKKIDQIADADITIPSRIYEKVRKRLQHRD